MNGWKPLNIFQKNSTAMEVVERSKADTLPLLILSCNFECEWKKTQTVYFMKAIRSIFSAIAISFVILNSKSNKKKD